MGVTSTGFRFLMKFQSIMKVLSTSGILFYP